MKIFLVNMDKSIERLNIMKKRLSDLDLTFERIAAVDGTKINDSEKKVITAPSWRYPYKLTPGEIGCFMSHQKCWKKLIESKENWALVLEDDSFFHSKAINYFHDIDWIPDGVKLIQFSYAIDDTYSDLSIKLENGDHLVRVKDSSPCGTYAYMISREAAIKALELSKTIEGPIDNFMFGMFFQFPQIIQSWRLKECVVRVIDDVEPTITGRGRKNRTISNFFLKAHPFRLIEKLKIKLNRVKLTKVSQEWHS